MGTSPDTEFTVEQQIKALRRLIFEIAGFIDRRGGPSIHAVQRHDRILAEIATED